jgi:hypothetical protein
MKRLIDILAGTIVIFSGMVYLGIAWLIATATNFTLDRSTVGLLGVLLLLSGFWLFMRRE